MNDILRKMEKLSLEHDKIPPELIAKKNIKLGLRNADGTGVIAGITKKGRVVGYKKYEKDGKVIVEPCEGKLYYCGYDVEKIIDDNNMRNTFGYDEVVYLLLTGELPNETDLNSFSDYIAKRRSLSKSERAIIMEEVQNENQMYGLHSVISHLGRCDPNPESIDSKDVSRQCINLIAKFPTIVAFNYSVMKYRKGGDLKIIRPKQELSTAENFLYMIHGKIPDKLEAHIFDTSMILHAEHGGGNNSTFTVRTVSSSGASTYMSIAAGIASLSGHLHGGANESVKKMMKELKKNVKDWGSEKEIENYLKALLDKKAGDRTGVIYGLGHAVYTLSDPRAKILQGYAKEFSKLKGTSASNEYQLYENVGRIASKLLSERKNKPICVNIDFYSGFVYELLGISSELFTPIFAMSRVAGWAAHRLEQIVQGKIMRPAYIADTDEERVYVTIAKRK